MHLNCLASVQQSITSFALGRYRKMSLHCHRTRRIKSELVIVHECVTVKLAHLLTFAVFEILGDTHSTDGFLYFVV